MIVKHPSQVTSGDVSGVVMGLREAARSFQTHLRFSLPPRVVVEKVPYALTPVLFCVLDGGSSVLIFQ